LMQALADMSVTVTIFIDGVYVRKFRGIVLSFVEIMRR
jgi:hypothetical protein